MIGRSSLAAASRTELHEEVVTQLNAGIAKPFSLAKFRRAHAASPVITPGLTPGTSFHDGMFYVICGGARNMSTLDRSGGCMGSTPQARTIISVFGDLGAITSTLGEKEAARSGENLRT